MKKYASIFILSFPLVFYTPCKGQNHTDPPKNNIKSETIGASPFGPVEITRNFIQDKKGNIWMATFDGVFRYNAAGFTNITDGVSSARFFSVLEDRHGNLWFGSIGSGVYKYNGKSFQNFTTANGLINNEIVCIYEDKAGNIWFGGNGGASRYDARLPARAGSDGNDGVGQGKSLLTGQAGFRNYIINGDSFQEDNTGKTFPNSPRSPYGVSSIMEDKAGKFWFGTSGNTFVYEPRLNDEVGKGKDFTVITRNGKPFKNVLSIIEDKKGNIWLGGSDGLWLYDGSTFINITYNSVGFVYEDRKGNIWRTSGGAGPNNWTLYRYDEKSLSDKYVAPEIIKSKEGMIFGVFEANDGGIWYGSLHGVTRYDGNAFNDFKGKGPQK